MDLFNRLLFKAVILAAERHGSEVANPNEDRYVNPGDDERFGGLLGKILSDAQERSAFKSSTPPVRQVTGSLAEGWLIEVSHSVPNNKPFVGIAIRKENGKWDTLRYGWRWDPNWGDERLKPGSFNPDPHIVGGYFKDFILKLNQARPHIDPES